MLLWLYCILLSTVPVRSDVSDDVQVHLTGLGDLRGGRGVARNGAPFYQFRGIPYAQPPTGERRLRRPLAVSAWQDVREATEFGPHCLQMPLRTPEKIIGSEDCLFLNVYTRSLAVTARRPVLVFIPGGAFIAGGASQLTGEYLLEQDLVLVTLQYRLGPLGWLTTGDREAPGNYGLQDQILALRWVQDHITQFGGDPDLVTLAGMSAGGASVSYLLLSPQTDGLFHRAVIMSGSALCWWANIPHQERTAARLASSLGCPTSPSASLLACLREVAGRDLMSAQAQLYPWHPTGPEKAPKNLWSPRPDPEAGPEAVLALEPLWALQAGHIQPVPVLVGTAESEGVWQAGLYLTREAVRKELVEQFQQVLQHSLGLLGQVREGQLEEVIKTLEHLYFTSGSGDEEDRLVEGLVNMFGDSLYGFPINTMLRLHARHSQSASSPVWVYQYNFTHNHSVAFLDPISPQMTVLHRASHSHEMPMLFPILLRELGPLSDVETEQSRKLIGLIMNFMLEGTPKREADPEQKDWLPLSEEGRESYFVIGQQSGSRAGGGLPHQERIERWDNLPVYWNLDSNQPATTQGQPKSEL